MENTPKETTTNHTNGRVKDKNQPTVSPFLLLRTFDLGPGITQRHRAVEDERSWLGVKIDAEIAHALELEAITGLGGGQARLDVAVRPGQERLRIQVDLVVLSFRIIIRIGFGEEMIV